MPPPRYRDLSKGDVLSPTYTDALEDLLSGYEGRSFNVGIASPTSIQVAAGGALGSVGLAINGEWRHIEATQTRSHPGGAAGDYDVYAVGSANSFAAGPPDVGEIDNTFYGFELRIVSSGAAAPTGTLTGGQAIAITRKVRTLHWDGAAITRVDRLSPEVPPLHAASHAPGGSDPLPVNAAAGVGSLRTIGTTATSAAAGNDPRLSDTRIPTGDASGGDLAGVYPAPSIKASVGLTGAPTAPTPAQDTGGTRIATAGYVLGQLSIANPLVNGAAAAGTSLRMARADHVHPTDTSRAAKAGDSFTGLLTGLAGIVASGSGVPASGQGVEFGVSGAGVNAVGYIQSQDRDLPAPLPFHISGIEVSLYSSSSLGFRVARDSSTGAPLLGAFGVAPAARPGATADIKAALASVGWLTAGSASPLNLEGGTLTAGAVAATTFPGTPNFTGAATGQTAALGDSSTKLATTAFVQLNASVLGSSTPLMDGAASAGFATSGSRVDHVHPTDSSRAPINSPDFAGAVTAPNPSTGDNSNRVATTSFVKNQGYTTLSTVQAQGYYVSSGAGSLAAGILDTAQIAAYGATRFFSDSLRTYVNDAAGTERLRASGSGILINQAAHYLGFTGWTFVASPNGPRRRGDYADGASTVANTVATLISDLKDMGILG